MQSQDTKWHKAPWWAIPNTIPCDITSACLFFGHRRQVQWWKKRPCTRMKPISHHSGQRASVSFSQVEVGGHQLIAAFDLSHWTKQITFRLPCITTLCSQIWGLRPVKNFMQHKGHSEKVARRLSFLSAFFSPMMFKAAIATAYSESMSSWRRRS